MVCLCSINPLTRVGGSRVEFELDRWRPVMKYGEKILRTFRTNKGETRPADGSKETLVRCISCTQACEYLHATCVWIHEDTKAVHVDGMECMFSTSLDWHTASDVVLRYFPFPFLRPYYVPSDSPSLGHMGDHPARALHSCSHHNNTTQGRQHDSNTAQTCLVVRHNPTYNTNYSLFKCPSPALPCSLSKHPHER